MKLGMFMHPIQDFRRGYHTLLKEDFEIIKCADAVGFDEVWLGEHFALPSEPIQSPLMLFAALVPQTERIKFGSGVLCLPYQHPAIVAGQAAQFDHISEGRFLMGIGPGATPPDFEMFKITDLDRMEMLVESIDMIHGIWASDPPYEFHGKYWDFEIKDNVLARHRRRRNGQALPAAPSAGDDPGDEPGLRQHPPRRPAGLDVHLRQLRAR